MAGNYYYKRKENSFCVMKYYKHQISEQFFTHGKIKIPSYQNKSGLFINSKR
jgi:hypothetical protein